MRTKYSSTVWLDRLKCELSPDRIQWLIEYWLFSYTNEFGLISGPTDDDIIEWINTLKTRIDIDDKDRDRLIALCIKKAD